MTEVNPWRPMTNPLDIKHVGKALEELGEAVAAFARCLIQGIDEREPKTGKPNREWLEEEMADVIANLALNGKHFGLDSDRVMARSQEKIAKLEEWHAMTPEAPIAA